MAIAALTVYVLVSGAIMLTAAMVFDGILLRQIIKKRTIGTILLFISYVLFTLGEISTISGNYIFSFFPSISNIAAQAQLLYSALYGLGFVFFYFFANRHILQDSDIVKAITSILISFTIGISVSISITEVIIGVSSNYYNVAELVGFVLPSGENMPQYLPSTIIGLLTYIPILIFIQLRIIIKIFRIRRGLENKIAKAGFTYIMFSVLFLVLGTLSSSFFLYDFVQSSPLMNGLFHSLRMFFNSLGFLFGYFGWILPDWLKKRIRGKAWIVKEMNRKQNIVIQPIAGAKIQTEDEVKAIEISDL